MERRVNEPLYYEVLAKTNAFLYPSGSKIYGKELRNKETQLKRTNFASLLVLCYIEVPRYAVLFFRAENNVNALLLTKDGTKQENVC